MSDVELAYLAGIVDADGYVSASASCRRGRWYFGAVVGITGSRREPHDLAARLWGGNVSCYEQGGTYKPQYHWQRMGYGAVPVLTALLPHLRIKLPQAYLAIALQDDLAMARSDPDDPYPWAPAGWDPAPTYQAQVAEIRALHARRAPAVVTG